MPKAAPSTRRTTNARIADAAVAAAQSEKLDFVTGA
jgi:hypothetical protein